MSDAVLTNDQTLKLLRELASNAGFRQRYEEKPAAALLEIGIPATTIANLPAACLAAGTLKTDAALFQAAEQELMKQEFGTTASMIIPNIRVR
jgi:putative modified peptide